MISPSWEQIRYVVLGRTRQAAIRRTTKETDVDIKLTLNASARSDIKTGLGFLDHMLDQIARHGNIDLKVHTTGDLYIDEHHTVEDTALALGSAFNEALQDKRGLARYGFAFLWTIALRRWRLTSEEALAGMECQISSRENWRRSHRTVLPFLQVVQR